VPAAYPKAVLPFSPILLLDNWGCIRLCIRFHECRYFVLYKNRQLLVFNNRVRKFYNWCFLSKSSLLLLNGSLRCLWCRLNTLRLAR
jgi:hypothetical protein